MLVANNTLVYRHPGLFFREHLASRKKYFYHFETEKIVLIHIHNIFVTKKFFFGNVNQNKIDPHVSCRPGRVSANQQVLP